MINGRKIFFLDLDGTTLCDDKSLSESNRIAIQTAMKMGHYVAVATGRAVAGAQEIIDLLDLRKPGGYLIAFNGAVGYECDTGKTLFETKLPREYAKYLHKEAAKRNLHIQTYGDNLVLTDTYRPELDFYKEESGLGYRVEPNLWDNLTDDVPKVLLCELRDRSKLESYRNDLAEWAKDKCNSIFSCQEYLEYCPLNASKGDGVRLLCQHLNIPIENSIAIGDQENDLSMIVSAGVGVAMCNGIEVVRNAADYITERDNNHDGVAEVFYKYM